MPDREIYHILSNTHWDREWYQSHEKYLVRLVELFDRLTVLLEEKPDYRFITDGQYALLDDYLAARPEMLERVKKLVENGQLLVGPWYTQPLENIVGGEALVRNLQYGISKSEKLGGAMRFSYEIDEFGHTSQLPQILAGFDIHGSMAWRGVPKNSKSVFEWTAPDGTSAYMFCSRAGYGFATTLPENEEDFEETIDGVTFKRRGIKNRVKDLREYSKFNSESNNMFWLNGIDHSWAQEDLLEVIEKIRSLFPDIEVKQSTPNEFMDSVLADYKAMGKKPEQVKGELIYTAEDILESTNSLHPRQKLRHYFSEKHLVDRFEPLATTSWLMGAKYPQWALERAWKYDLENHAHDSLGCCSVDEVYEQVMARYGASISLSEQEENNALRYIMSCSSADPAVFVFNLSSYEISGAHRVNFDIPTGYCDGFFELYTPDGNKVEMSIISKELVGDVRYNPRRGHPTWGKRWKIDAILNLPTVPAAGWMKLSLKKTVDEERVDNRRYHYLEASPYTMENENLIVTISDNGKLNVTDKDNPKAVFSGGLVFEDTGECDSVYVHCEPENDRRVIYSGAPTSVTCLFDTPLGSAYELCFEMNIPDGLTADKKKRSEICKPLKIKTVVSLMKGDRKVGLKIHIENQSRYHRLRVLFPTNYENAVSAGGQAFDYCERVISVPYDPELPREQDYPTKPFIDYCCVSGEGAGLGIAAKGIYEYECIDNKAQPLALTLLRCVEDIDTKTFAITPEYKCHEAQNLTEIDYELALIPYDGNKANLLKEVSSFVAPLITEFNRQTEDSVLPDYKRPSAILPDIGSAIKVNGDGVTVTCFKRAMERDTVIVRLLNNTDDTVETSVELTVPEINVNAVYENTLEEKRLAKLSDSSWVNFTLTPHKLITLEFEIE